MEEPNMLQPKDEPITIEFDALIEDPLKLPKSEQIKEEEDPNYKLVCVESSRLLETQDPQNGKSVSHHVQDESTIDHKDVLRNSIISQLMMQVKDEPPSSEFEATMEDQEIKVKIEQPIETIDDLSSNFPDTVSTESLDVPSLESIQAHDDTGAGSSTIISRLAVASGSVTLSKILASEASTPERPNSPSLTTSSFGHPTSSASSNSSECEGALDSSVVEQLTSTDRPADTIASESPVPEEHTTHREYPSLRCEFCLRSFENRMILNEHMMRVHTPKSGKAFCSLCSKLFNKKYLPVHELVCKAPRICACGRVDYENSPGFESHRRSCRAHQTAMGYSSNANPPRNTDSTRTHLVQQPKSKLPTFDLTKALPSARPPEVSAPQDKRRLPTFAYTVPPHCVDLDPDPPRRSPRFVGAKRSGPPTSEIYILDP